MNPLAAVFALAAAKRAEEGGKRGSGITISKDKEFQLMYNIKNAFEEDFAKRQMMEKMSGALREQALSRHQMQDIIDEAEDILEQDIVESRAQDNCLYQRCLRVQQSKAFTIFIAAAIIGNTIVLAFDRYPIDTQTERLIEFYNTLFYVIFLLEMIVKIIGLGFKMYFMDKANSFDFFVIVISTVDLLLSTLGTSVSGSEAI